MDNKIYEQIDTIISTCENKEQVEQLGAIKQAITQKVGELEDKLAKRDSEYKDLLHDYANAVKNSAYKLDKQPEETIIKSESKSLEEMLLESLK